MGGANRSFLNIAHRGASAYEPENTVKAFQRAIEMGCDMVELDVRRSKDDRLIIMHDSTVNRTTNGYGYVRQKTLEELKELDAGGGEKIPTLQEVMDIASGKTGLVIELKEEGTEKAVLELIRKYDCVDKSYVISFKRGLLKTIKQLEPEIKTGLVLSLAIGAVSRGRECEADAIGPYHFFITPGLVRKAEENDMVVLAWTVNSPGRAQKLLDMGVRGIVTDMPDMF
ncbi:MAG: glycerophosphodiester phosphodiesterase [Candidatus Dadabacteria bacterium]|nr:glycerophosphodiester phosphodiesterase [Candidatus Dadabacteria bacterium]